MAGGGPCPKIISPLAAPRAVPGDSCLHEQGVRPTTLSQQNCLSGSLYRLRGITN